MANYEPLAGTTITNAANEMVALANEANEIVTAKFNDIEITANPGGDPQAIVSFYHEECEWRAEVYRNSPVVYSHSNGASEMNILLVPPMGVRLRILDSRNGTYNDHFVPKEDLDNVILQLKRLGRFTL